MKKTVRILNLVIGFLVVGTWAWVSVKTKSIQGMEWSLVGIVAVAMLGKTAEKVIEVGGGDAIKNLVAGYRKNQG